MYTALRWNSSSTHNNLNIETFGSFPSSLSNSNMDTLHADPFIYTTKGNAGDFGEEDREKSRPIAIEEELQSSVFKLSSSLGEYQKRVNEYKSRVDTLKAQIDKVQMESARKIQSLENEHRKVIQAMRSDLKVEVEANSKMEKNYTALEQLYKSSLEKNGEDLNVWKNRFHQTSVEMETFRSVNCTNQKKIDELQTLICELRKENEQLRLQNNAFQQNLDNYNKLKTDPSQGRKCDCLEHEYKMLYELSVLKLNSLEHKHNQRTTFTFENVSSGTELLLESVVDLARVGGCEIEIADFDQSDSTISCESPNSATSNQSSPLRCSINEARTSSPSPHELSPTVRTRKSSLISRIHDGISHNSIHLSDFRPRAFSDLPTSRLKHLLTKRFSNDNIPHEDKSLSKSTSNLYSHRDDKISMDKESCLTSRFCGLQSRRNGITTLPLDISVSLRMQDAKKNKEFSHLLRTFHRDK